MSERKSILRALMHGLGLAGAFLVLARGLTLPLGLISGALGCLLGPLLAAAFAKARLRMLPSLLFGFGLGALALGAAWLLDGVPAISELFGGRGALEAAEGVRIGGLALAACFLLRRWVEAWRGFLVLEAGVVVWAVAAPFAAHRDGMIARPLELADFLWRRGLDPVWGFLGLGAVAAVLVAASLARARPLRGLLHVLFAGLIVLLLGGPLYRSGSPPPLREPGGGAGERGAGSQGSARPDSASDGLDGLGTDPTPNQQSRERRPVAVVLFRKDVRPTGGVYYFRDAVFSRFNGSRLVESSQADLDPDLVWRFPTRRMEVPAPPEAMGLRTRAALEVAMITEHGRAFTLVDPVEVEPRANPSPARFTRAYGMVSSVVSGDPNQLFGRTGGDPAWDAETWAHYTDFPSDTRYLELAKRLDAQLQGDLREDPFGRALMVAQHLAKTTIYSFAPRHEGADPTASFLFVEGDRKGSCTHLAHSAALLLRALGVPTRVSGGYAAEATRTKGGSALLLFGGDAHAWVEVYLEGVGWVPVEITPERTEVEPPPFQERDLQQLLGEMARAEGAQTEVPEAATDLGALGRRLLAALPWALLLLLAGAYGVRWIRALRIWIAPERVGWAYRSASEGLAARGRIRRRGESRERFALRVQAEAPSMLALTALLGATVLGRSEVGRAPGGRSAAALAGQVSRELGRSLPWWQTLLGWLHPIPWLFSR